jgi:NAD-dependent dihydropyrimidine dehydrogenase PreA subunit
MDGDEIYRDLQRDLDRMPVGFPATEAGVEIRILKQLFSPEEARIAMRLDMLGEPVATIHRRLDDGMPLEALRAVLDDMAYRGLIHVNRDGAEPRFSKLPFVVGIYEGQVDRMSPQLAHDLMEYFDAVLGRTLNPGRTTQLRTVPVNSAIRAERGVSTYDDIREHVRRSPGPFAVMNCICRQAKDLDHDPCKQTQVRDNCLTMGAAAVIMMRHDRAREIPRERMIELLDEADREGLILQPQNTRNPLFVCCCCSCCCVALRAGKHSPKPAEFFTSNFFIGVDEEMCGACGECLSRCQLDALSMEADSVRADLERCIGCGLCVPACPSGALSLREKPVQQVPPAEVGALYARIYRERFGTLGLAKAVGRHVARRIRLSSSPLEA